MLYYLLASRAEGCGIFFCCFFRVCHLFGERSTMFWQRDTHDRARHTSDSCCCYLPKIADKDTEFNNLINYSNNALYCRVRTILWSIHFYVVYILCIFSHMSYSRFMTLEWFQLKHVAIALFMCCMQLSVNGPVQIYCAIKRCL